MRKRSVYFWMGMALLSFFFTHQGISAKPSLSNKQRMKAEQSIFESSVRYELRNHEAGRRFDRRRQSGQDTSARVYFICINGKDPSDDFMKRIAKFSMPVKKCSQSYLYKPNAHKKVGQLVDAHIRDKETDMRGVLVGVGALKWLNRNRVVVEHRYYFGPEGAGMLKYVVEWRQNRWAVVRQVKGEGFRS